MYYDDKRLEKVPKDCPEKSLGKEQARKQSWFGKISFTRIFVLPYSRKKGWNGEDNGCK